MYGTAKQQNTITAEIINFIFTYIQYSVAVRVYYTWMSQKKLMIFDSRRIDFEARHIESVKL